MQEAFDPADVDEGPEAGQGADVAGQLLALLDRPEDPPFLLLPLVLQEQLARDHRVLGLAVEADDLELARLAQNRVGVLDRAHVGVRIGHEGHDPDIDVVAAAGPIDDLAGDEGAVGGGLVQGFQGLLGVGFLFGEDEVAFLVVGPFQRGFDLVARLGQDDVGSLAEFLQGDHPLGFHADVDEDVVGGDLDDPALDDGPGRNLLLAELVLVQQGLVVLHGHLVVVRLFRVGHGTRISSWCELCSKACSMVRTAASIASGGVDAPPEIPMVDAPRSMAGLIWPAFSMK